MMRIILEYIIFFPARLFSNLCITTGMSLLCVLGLRVLCNLCVYLNPMQMSVAVKKILYAADAKESALADAQEYLSQFTTSTEAEAEAEIEADA